MSPLTTLANAKCSIVRTRIEHVFARQNIQMRLFISTIGIAQAEVNVDLCNLAYIIDRLILHERHADME